MRYPVIDTEWGKIQLDKGEVVCDMGKSKNVAEVLRATF